jgi:transketolase
MAPKASPELPKDLPKDLVDKSVNTIRMLAADAVQMANSGHPGMPMGCADLAFVLWTRHLRFNPHEPRWADRDRFLLSAGHGSMLLYGLLHLAGFDVTLEDLKKFRQLESRTPGHPEFGHTAGVECTTGPLGQGFANGVGMALGQAMLSAKLGPGNPIEGHFIYAIVSDGDLMEGVAAEAASFAGHHKLGRIIYLYDDNGITIDGKTELSYTGEDVTKRFEGYGWQVAAVDGRDHQGISRAITAAQADPRPSLIRVRTTIGYGAPKKQGTSGVHGAPLGEEELAAAKDFFKWPREPRLHVPDEVRSHWKEITAGKIQEHQAWAETERAWRERNPEKAKLLDEHLKKAVPADIGQKLLAGEQAPSESTRKLSGAAINKVAALVPSLVGGSADLAESNNTDIKGGGSVGPGSYHGRNLHFGVREHAMGAICNGLAYDGWFIPYAGTFLIFSDYMRPSVRLAALSGLQVIYVWTHDSIFLGEDGPTHQPVEHLTALRAMPNLHLVRPADGFEVDWAWAHALTRRDGPTGLALTRQKLPKLERPNGFDPALAAKGGYVISEPAKARFTLIATGSELPAAQAALAKLSAKGIEGRLVSVPCLACFEAQPQGYRDGVIPPKQPACVVEAARGTEWYRHIGRDGLLLGIEKFGASAPDKALAQAYGFTPDQIADRIGRWIG